MTSVAFIGLGAMGAPMAENLQAAGFTVRVFNRNPARTRGWSERGYTVCESPAEAVAGARFAVSIVSDDEASREVMLGTRGLIGAAAPGTILIDSSTNSPATARALAQAAQTRGLIYLDAPVTGSMAQSRNRELGFMVGGDAEAFRACEPLFRAMGRKWTLMGASGTGATIKLVNNMLSATVTSALAEGWSIVEAAGLDPQAATEVLCEGGAASRLTRTKLPKMHAREFGAQFQLALMEKDLRYFLGLAQETDRPVPIASLVRSQLQGARRAALGELDVSAVFLHINREEPSTPPVPPGTP